MVELTPISPEDTAGFRPVNQFSVLRIGAPDSMAQVLAEVDRLRAEAPDQGHLVTLDNLGQALYTSMHALEDPRFHVEEPDLDWDDPASDRVYEAAVLEHAVQVLADPAHRVEVHDVAARLAYDDAEVAALGTINRTPELLLDDPVYVQRIPVAENDLLLAGLVNGYFTSDLDVFENQAIVRHLALHHGYRFLGIGASTIGFDRHTPPTPEQAAALVADLGQIYGCPQAVGWQELAGVLTGSRVLAVGYTENLADDFGG